MTKKSKTVGSLVYCGPNIKGLAMTWTIYTNGLPEKLQAAAGLIVPLDQMPEAMKQIRMKYGRIYTYYKRVLDAQKG